MRKTTATLRIKLMPCSECGELMPVGSNTRNAKRHLECGLAILADEIRQMREKSGPHYEHWLAGMAQRFGQG